MLAFLDFLYSLDWTQILIWGVPTVGGALIVWYRKRLIAWKAFWRDVLDGLRGIPGLQADVKGISAFVGPNGSGPIMDAVLRAEKAVAAIGEQLDLMVYTTQAENDTDDTVGRFHCSDNGKNTYVNQIFARWLGVGKPELLGWGWLSFVHPSDISRLREHWDVCKTEHREFRISYRLVPTAGKAFEVNVIAKPVPDTSPAKAWIGSIRRTESGYTTTPNDPATPKTPVVPQ